MPPTWTRFLALNVHIINRLTQKLSAQVVGQNRHLDANLRGHMPYSPFCGHFSQTLVSRCKKCRPPGCASKRITLTKSTIYHQTCLSKCRPKIDTGTRTYEVTHLTVM